MSTSRHFLPAHFVGILAAFLVCWLAARCLWGGTQVMSLMGENVLADGGHRPPPLTPTPHFQLKEIERKEDNLKLRVKGICGNCVSV